MSPKDGTNRAPNEGKGRPKGAVNKLTKTVKEAVQRAFDTLQKDKKANLIEWGKENPSDFYRIAAKLIPNTVEAEVTGELKHTITEIRRVIVRPRSTDR